MIQQSSPQFWDKTAQEFDTIYSGKEKSPVGVLLDRWLRRDIYDRIDETVRLVNTLGPHQRVLDVGTGTGRLCVPLAKAGHTVVGVDFSPVMLGMAQRLTAEAGVAEQCRFYQGDLVAAIPEELAAHPAFDVVASLGVFDYISDPRGMLMHMRQFAPRRIIGTFPREGTLRCHVRQWRYRLQSLDCPLFFYTVGQLEAIGQELGASRTHIQPMGELHFAVFEFEGVGGRLPGV